MTAAAPRKPITPDRYERLLAVGAIAMLGLVLTAIARGHESWAVVPTVVWLHLATIVAALVLTPVLMLRTRGDRLHRRLGWAWATAMFATALLSFAIRLTNDGGFSAIHILSAITVAAVPSLVLSARSRRVAAHRRTARAIVTGALLVAGAFTFPFHRLLGQWLFG